MNTDKKIHQAFNNFESKGKENYFIPGVQSTVFPIEKLIFNDWIKYIFEEVNKNYLIKKNIDQ